MKLTEIELESIMESRYYNEWDLKYVNVEGKCMSLSWYILLMCIDDLDLYVRQGKKPHKAWKISTIKAYFNISGHSRDLLNKLNEIKKMCEDEKI